MQKEVVLALYEETERIARDFNERMDNAVRYFTAIFFALISISIGLWNSTNNPLFAVLPLLAAVTVFIGLGELRRLNSRYLDNRATNMKARYWLGLHDVVDKSPFTEDWLFFPKEYLRPKEYPEGYLNGEQFVQEHMRRPDFKRTWKNLRWETCENVRKAFTQAFWYGKARYLSYITILFMVYVAISVILAFVMAWKPLVEFVYWLIRLAI